jgi:hypothetical protein
MNGAALYQAIYTRLAGTAAVASKVQGIYSRVPMPADAGDDGLFPYIFFNQPSALPFNTKTSDGMRAIIQVHVYSRSGSNIERLAIQDAVYDALHNYDLPIAGANTVLCQFQGVTDFMDPDGITTHGVVSFTVLYDDI